MIVSDYHNLSSNFDSDISNDNTFDWHLDSEKYTNQQIGEMPNWIKSNKAIFQQEHMQIDHNIDINNFSDRQKLAYDIVIAHSNASMKEPLLFIINVDAGTGKSYLINSLRTYLGNRCIISATTGKAAYNINGVKVHSVLNLPIASRSQRALTGESLSRLQNSILNVEYLLIDEYSMLGQTTFGWIDQRCRQATGKQQQLFGGISIILVGDPAKLPPVCDKPLYHSKPSNQVGEQGHIAYHIFDKVVILTVNQRVKGSNSEQVLFRQLLSRLRDGETTEDDWKCLLKRQPANIKDIISFKNVTRLYYSNDNVAK